MCALPCSYTRPVSGADTTASPLSGIGHAPAGTRTPAFPSPPFEGPTAMFTVTNRRHSPRPARSRHATSVSAARR